MAVEHLSHSSVESLSQCGERFRLEKEVKVPRLPGWALVGGSHVHTVTENLDMQDFGITVDGPLSFSDTWEQAIVEQEEKTGYARDLWKASGRSSKAYPDKENERFWRDNGDQYVQNWRRFVLNSAYQNWITPEGLPAIEIELHGDVGGVPVKGYVDRIMEDTRTGHLLVVDLKSGANRPKGPKQLVLYRHLLSRAFGPDVVLRFGAYYMVRDGILTDPVDIETLDDGRLEHDYQTAWKTVQEGRYLPSLSMLCGSCGVRDYCREWGGANANDHLPYTPKDAA